MSLTPQRKFRLVVQCYWLQLGRIDIEQAEGLSLDRGWGGNQGEAVSVVEGGGHLVEGAGGEVAQQGLEAVHRAALGGDFAGALVQRRWRGLGRCDDRGSLAGGGNGIVVVEQHGFEAFAHVPFDMAGEHAQEDMGAPAAPARGGSGAGADRQSSGCERRARRGRGPYRRRPRPRPWSAMRSGLRAKVKPSSPTVMSNSLASL